LAFITIFALENTNLSLSDYPKALGLDSWHIGVPAYISEW